MPNNLIKRFITAFIIISTVIYIILFSNEVVVRLFLNFIIFLSAFEISKMCFYNEGSKSNKKYYLFIVTIFLSIFICNLLIKNDIWQYFIIASIIIWGFIFKYIYSIKEVHKINNFSNLYFFVYILVLSAFYCSVYVIYKLSPSSLIFLIVLIALSDTSAYFIGKSYGNRPFFNQISPNKTLEGFFGSLFSCFVFVILFCFFRDFDLYFSIKLIMLSTFAVIISSFGDLSVSLIKRFSDKKDTGSMLPGHGGILDRVDSILPAAPIFLIFSYFLSVII
ncbi:MAG: phosphatidate cytidylyltransferase [Gammaproteobacteria bacterium]